MKLFSRALRTVAKRRQLLRENEGIALIFMRFALQHIPRFLIVFLPDSRE